MSREDSRQPRPSLAERPVTVLLDDVHLTYRVHSRVGEGAESSGVGFRSGRVAEVQAVRGVSLEVRKGEVVGVIGHNGAGKSTLMRAIAGLIQPSRGRVLVSSQPQRIDVSWALNGHLTGRENVRLGLLGLGFSPSEIAELAPAVMAFADLGDFIDLPLRAYSSGMRQRLGFAIATESAPEILLMDEALAVGDRDFRERSAERVEALRGGAGTIILASHALAMVRETCDRVLWMRDGVVGALGAPDEVVQQYEEHATAQRNTLRQERKQARRQDRRVDRRNSRRRERKATQD